MYANEYNRTTWTLVFLDFPVKLMQPALVNCNCFTVNKYCKVRYNRFSMHRQKTDGIANIACDLLYAGRMLMADYNVSLRDANGRSAFIHYSIRDYP